MKFEAGTPGIVQQIGLGVALDYMMGLGMDAIAAHETRLCATMRGRGSAGSTGCPCRGRARTRPRSSPSRWKAPAHAHDISTVLDKKGVAVRAGKHCAGPLMQHLGLTATCRASFGLYNTEAEVDALVEALELCHELFA